MDEQPRTTREVPATEADRSLGFTAIVLAIAGIALRSAHNVALLDSPLYWHPLGGHTVFLKTAAEIWSGDLLPGSRPFVENSPLYPYVLALGYAVFGQNLLLTRLLTILADGGTILLVTLLGARYFGRRAGIAAGLLYAVYAPAIFFSAELIYTSYAVLLSTAAAWAIDRPPMRSAAAAGVAAGLAIALMPSLVLYAPLLVATPFIVRGTARPAARAAIVAVSIGATIAPVTLANYVNSGHLVLLTTSAGHNFYIGHNPLSRPGYHLPNRIGPVTFSSRGSIFDNMKTVAETAEARPLSDAEVSSYFFAKGMAHVAAHPVAEAVMVGKRFAALLNRYEATTYADFYFQREISPVLRWTFGFDLLFALALLGCVRLAVRRHFALLAPVLVATASVLVFFYLSRFRMPMVPIACVLGGAGVVRLYDAVARREWRPAIVGIAVAAGLVMVARISWVTHDSANEWNKVGAVWMSDGELARAEGAFEKARAENPRDPHAYLNLARVYEARGETARALTMRQEGASHMPAAEGAAFGRQLSAAPAEGDGL